MEIAQLLTFDPFVSISLKKENLRGLRENLKHEIPTYGFLNLPQLQTSECLESNGPLGIQMLQTDLAVPEIVTEKFLATQ